MTVFQAIILGAIQGVAEFLPISSSGHLLIAEYFLGRSETPLVFDLLLHLATLIVVFIIFRERIGQLFIVLGRFLIRKSKPTDSDDLKIILTLLISTAITCVIGFLIKDYVKAIDLRIVSFCFILTGLFLVFAGKMAEKREGKASLAVPSFFSAIIIGLSQGIGVIPGISRSGSTISAALATGLDRKKAGEFSFLLSIPAILGALMLELKSTDNLANTVATIPLIAGMISSFVVGYISLTLLLKLIKSGKISYFAFYLVPLGIGLFIYFSI